MCGLRVAVAVPGLLVQLLLDAQIKGTGQLARSAGLANELEDV